MSSYFVIGTNEDGEVSCNQIEGGELSRRLVDHYYGDRVKFYREVPKDHMYVENWSADTILIIKGDVIWPKPVKVVTEYDLP